MRLFGINRTNKLSAKTIYMMCKNRKLVTMAKRLTDREAYELYLHVWPNNSKWNITDNCKHTRQKRIATDVRAILTAPTLDEAFKICWWWIVDNNDSHPLRSDVAWLRRLGRRRQQK